MTWLDRLYFLSMCAARQLTVNVDRSFKKTAIKQLKKTGRIGFCCGEVDFEKKNLLVFLFLETEEQWLKEGGFKADTPMKTKQNLYYPTVFKTNLMRMGIDSKEIVEATGLKNYTVSRMFAEKPIVTLENAVTISKCMNIPLDSLFDETYIPRSADEGKG